MYTHIDNYDYVLLQVHTNSGEISLDLIVHPVLFDETFFFTEERREHWIKKIDYFKSELYNACKNDIICKSIDFFTGMAENAVAHDAAAHGA